MNQPSHVIRRYLAQVRRALRCPSKDRQALLTRLQADLTEYAAQQPSLSLADLTEQFGSPAQLAADYLETLDPLQIKRYRASLTHRVQAAAVCLCILLSLMIGYSIWSFHHPVQVIPGDSEVTPDMAEDVKASHCMFDFLVRSYCRRFGEPGADGSYQMKENDEIGLYRYLYAVGVTPGLLQGTDEQTRFVRGTSGLRYDPNCDNPYIEGYIQWFTNPHATRSLILYSAPPSSLEN